MFGEVRHVRAGHELQDEVAGITVRQPQQCQSRAEELTRSGKFEHFDDLFARPIEPPERFTCEKLAAVPLFKFLATGGHELALRSTTLNEIEQDVKPTRDLVIRIDTSFTMGFMKRFVPFGSGPRAFGHTGAGGSFGFADPDTGVGYAYAMNRAGWAVPFDPRDIALREALSRSIG